MFASPTVTIGFALAIATGLVCFGIIRLLRFFRGELDRDNLSQDGNYPLNTGANAIHPEVKRP